MLGTRTIGCIEAVPRADVELLEVDDEELVVRAEGPMKASFVPSGDHDGYSIQASTSIRRRPEPSGATR